MEEQPCLDIIPEEILLYIASFLPFRDIIHLSMTCQRIKRILPTFKEIRGPDIEEHGPSPALDCPGSDWDPKCYFDTPRLISPVQKLIISMNWKDQVGHICIVGICQPNIYI